MEDCPLLFTHFRSIYCVRENNKLTRTEKLCIHFPHLGRVLLLFYCWFPWNRTQVHDTVIYMLWPFWHIRIQYHLLSSGKLWCLTRVTLTNMLKSKLDFIVSVKSGTILSQRFSGWWNMKVKHILYGKLIMFVESWAVSDEKRNSDRDTIWSLSPRHKWRP